MSQSATAAKDKKKVLVVDGNSWMHRGFHAIASPLTAPDGRPTGAIFGFLSMLTSVVRELEPNAVVVAFDAGVPEFRLKALEEYKIQRPPTDPDLKMQFPMMEKILESMSVPVVKLEGWEGDDILGTLARQGDEDGKLMLLATGDHDAYQLVNDNVWVVSQGRRVGELNVMTADKIEERYGITPEQVVDYLGLKGDPSDNIPGIKGVGEKTASRLLVEYGSLEEVIDAAERGEVKGKMGERLATGRKDAENSRVVATIERYLPLEIDFDEIEFGNWNNADMEAAFAKLNMNAPLRNLRRLQDQGIIAGSSGEEGCIPNLSEAQDKEHLLIENCEFVGLDIREGGATLFDQGVCLGVTSAKESTYYADDKAKTALRELVATKPFAVRDLKDFFAVAYTHDSAKEALIDIDELDSTKIFDLAIAAYVLDASRSKFDLQSLAGEYLLGFDESEFSKPEMSTEEELKATSKLTRELSAILESELKDKKLDSIYRDIEIPLSLVLARMERAGIALDVSVLEQMSTEISAEIDALTTQIHKLAGQEFSIDSPKQLSQVLFEDLKLTPGRKTKTGYSTDAGVLEGLLHEHEIVPAIIRYRELTKLRSTYVDKLPKERGEDGRIHTTFLQTVAATGRLSSKDPNLQNIPVRTALGKRVREAFVPSEKGWKLLSADYSQIELRVLAHLSKDKGLIEAFKSGEDFHAATAARLFDVETDSVDSDLRARAKAVNFGIIYGQSAHALAVQLDLPYTEAQAIIDRYYGTFPGVKKYLDDSIAFAKRNGYVTTAFGRLRALPDIYSSNYNIRAFGERTAMNTPMQGTAADLIKMAMIAVDKRLREENFKARMLLQVHDELVFEAPEEEIERLQEMVRDAMENVAEFEVDLEVSMTVGDNWAEA